VRRRGAAAAWGEMAARCRAQRARGDGAVSTAAAGFREVRRVAAAGFRELRRAAAARVAASGGSCFFTGRGG
jgi:hypothetical protein